MGKLAHVDVGHARQSSPHISQTPHQITHPARFCLVQWLNWGGSSPDETSKPHTHSTPN